VPISPYIRDLRQLVGSDLLVLPSVTAVVFDPDRRVLLVREHGSREWHLPGGIIDPGERPADAVVREAWEETGLRVRPARLIGVFGGPDFLVVYPNGDRSLYTTAAFECVPEAGEPRAVDGEIEGFRWTAREELASIDVARRIHEVLAPAWEPGGEAVFAPPEWRPPPEP
jgi:8-oxo-dGTP pyrophosphatase MutT (NUDIX family)